MAHDIHRVVGIGDGGGDREMGDGMRTDRTVLNFIHHFNKRHDETLSDVERCFTDGCCWWFAHILCERFNGEMVYDEIDGHFGCEISGRVYDITGDVTDTFRKTYWSVFVEREPNLSVRILRRCRDFEEGA